jgi:hypothetical protein
MSAPDFDGYKQYLDDVNRAESVNAQAYDNALLTLSSASLALSLAFTKDLVPFSKATLLWLLYGSWICFALTIVITISSFLYGQHSIRLLKRGAKAYYLRGKRSLEAMSRRIAKRNDTLNVSCGVTFILGVLLLTAYVILNVQAGVTMSNDSKEILKKNHPLPNFGQRPPAPSPSPSNTPAQPAPTPTKKP